MSSMVTYTGLTWSNPAAILLYEASRSVMILAPPPGSSCPVVYSALFLGAHAVAYVMVALLVVNLVGHFVASPVGWPTNGY